MAVDMFPEDQDDQRGNNDKEFAKGETAIDVLAWSWGISNSGTTHQGGVAAVRARPISRTSR